MALRTDLAIEMSGGENEDIKGVEKEYNEQGDIKITTVKITSVEGERATGKPMGEYITLEFPPIYKICDFSVLEKTVISGSGLRTGIIYNYAVPTTHKVTLGEIVDLLYEFKASRENKTVPDMRHQMILISGTVLNIIKFFLHK